MNGPVAQIAALTAYGNAFLSNRKVPFDLCHSTAMFCNNINFTRNRPGLSRRGAEQIAPDVDSWFEYLASQKKVTHLRLHHLPPRQIHPKDRFKITFLDGDCCWLIETVHGETSDLWEARWEITQEKHPEQRIWSVSYAMVKTDIRSIPAPPFRLDPVYNDLKTALQEIEKFAIEFSLMDFTPHFHSGLHALDTEDPLDTVFHDDIVPWNTYSLKARQILAACQAAWVFGGIDSWGELSFDGDTQMKYETLSDALFVTINNSIIAAINSFPSLTGIPGAAKK